MKLLDNIRLVIENSGNIDLSDMKLEAVADGTDTSSIDTDESTPYLDTQKQVVAVRPTQHSTFRSGGDADSGLFQAMNPYFKIGRKP